MDNGNPFLMQDVIDEIERLRNDLAEAGHEYNKLWEKHNSLMRDRIHQLTNNYTDFKDRRNDYR